MWDEASAEYRVYSKTWIDGIDGGMYWKRAVALHTSKDFITWQVRTISFSSSSLFALN